jgi:hypothetical protein
MGCAGLVCTAGWDHRLKGWDPRQGGSDGSLTEVFSMDADVHAMISTKSTDGLGPPQLLTGGFKYTVTWSEILLEHVAQL